MCFFYSLSNETTTTRGSSFDVPDSRRSSEDSLFTNPGKSGLTSQMASASGDLPPIMSPIFESSNVSCTEDEPPAASEMKERRASLTLPFNSQPLIQILPTHKSNPQVTLSPTFRHRSPNRNTSGGAAKQIRKKVVLKNSRRRQREYEKSKGSSVSLDNNEVENR